ncbi:MAG: ABC transporter ATP-binding protein [Clostridia bacterium]|nr:ABC transporter ATP-binding protein [Clostridia bacterium]
MKDSKSLAFIFKNIRPYMGLVALIALEGAVLSVCGVLLALASRRLINIAFGSFDGSFLATCIFIGAVVLLQVVGRLVGNMLRTSVAGKITIDLRRRIFSQLLGKDYAGVAEYHSGELLNRCTGDIDHVVSVVTNVFPNTISLATRFLAAAVVLVYLEPKLAVVALVVGVIILFGSLIYKGKYKKLHKECQKSEGKTRSLLQECFEYIVVIKSFVSGTPVSRRLDNLMQDNYDLKMKRAWVSGASGSAVSLAFSAGYYLAVAWGAYGIIKGSMDYGTLVALMQLISQIRMPITGMSGLIPQYYSALASAERLMELCELEDEAGCNAGINADETYDKMNSIEFSNVTFAYDAEDVISDGSFSVPKGSITALVGKSGQGKSTVFKILLGLFHPSAGRVVLRCDGADMTVDASTRRLFAYVPQGNMILSGTVRSNLEWGAENITEDQLKDAARAADILDFIESLPNGFDTELGERGQGMSEGQIQRLSIARALLSGAPILLLDECTSALDETTERRVLGNIKELKTKTVLIITHGKAALEMCDSTVRLEDGKFANI